MKPKPKPKRPRPSPPRSRAAASKPKPKVKVKVKVKPAKPESAPQPELRVIGIQDLSRRVGILEEQVAQIMVSVDSIRGAIDKLDELVSDIFDKMDEKAEAEAPIEVEAERRLTVNQKYLSGRWPRRDGTVYAPMKEVSHVKGSGKPAPKRSRALRAGGRGASPSR